VAGYHRYQGDRLQVSMSEYIVCVRKDINVNVYVCRRCFDGVSLRLSISIYNVYTYQCVLCEFFAVYLLSLKLPHFLCK